LRRGFVECARLQHGCSGSDADPEPDPGRLDADADTHADTHAVADADTDTDADADADAVADADTGACADRWELRIALAHGGRDERAVHGDREQLLRTADRGQR
jgi:hypothetical protein